MLNPVFERELDANDESLPLLPRSTSSVTAYQSNSSAKDNKTDVDYKKYARDIEINSVANLVLILKGLIQTTF